jgi:uncharacterized membrane protein
MTVTPRPYTAVKFEIDVSTRYHEYRRAWLESIVTIIRLVSLLGSIVALLALSNWVESRDAAITTVVIATAFIGIVNLVDLVFHVDASARDHTTLYQRFKALQAKMTRHQIDWESAGPEVDAEAQEIRIDEPPTYYATYARAWNQTLEKYNESQHKRPLSWWQSVVGNLIRFRPDKFRPA